jgi:molybdopterin-guanine dinucleotide biosynthesis protein A
MLTIAILTGGKSKRMGQDKAVMPFRGEALVQCVMDRLAVLAAEVILIGPESAELLKLGVRIVPDLIPGRGPLGGLYTALFTANQPAIACVACDMPLVNADLLAFQREILISNNLDVVVPSSVGGMEPLHAIYRKETCHPAVREALDAGEHRLISWFSHVKVRTLTPDETIPFDRHGLMFLNINNPKELARAEKMEMDLIIPQKERILFNKTDRK